MFYTNAKGKKVQILNKRPRNLSVGGIIRDHPHIHNHTDDTIQAKCEYGSLVVPVPIMRKHIMDEYKGAIKGAKQLDPRKLQPTIVMPNELVVNKKYAGRVERFLKSKNITLPLGRSNAGTNTDNTE